MVKEKVTKVQKSINDSKLKKQFTKRSKGRIEKSRDKVNKPDFIDKKARKEKKEESAGEESDVDGSDFDQEMAQVEAEIRAEEDVDDTEFQKYETGELDLPSEDED